ncbi:MAG: hypothetical protein WDO15_18935 [Bacteroidota bacterium]
MKNIISLLVLLFISVATNAQDKGEIPIPLSDPSKRAKLKVHINYGSIDIKGTARKDVLVKYSGENDDNDHDDDGDDDRKSSKGGLKRIGGGTLDLEVSENANFVKVQSDSWSTKINLIIEVPNGIDLQLHTYNDGDIVVETSRASSSSRITTVRSPRRTSRDQW